MKEETGFDVEVVGLVGTYTDPKHVFEYDDGEVRQEVSICMLARIVGGKLAVSDESFEVAFHSPEGIADLPMVDSIRLRIADYLAGIRQFSGDHYAGMPHPTFSLVSSSLELGPP